jgi:hypothetical protein
MKFNRAQFDREVTPELSECIQRWSFCVLLSTAIDTEDGLGGRGSSSEFGRLRSQISSWTPAVPIIF